MSASPFVLEVYDRDLWRLGEVTAPSTLQATVRWNAVGVCTFTIGLQHRRALDLLDAGAAVAVRYQGLTAPLLSGAVRQADTKVAQGGALTFEVHDAFSLLDRVLGWPKPGNSLLFQDAEADVRSGPLESVAKGVIAANTARLGLPVQVLPDQGRGPQVRAEWRMQPLLAVLGPLLEQGGLGLTVQLADPLPQADGRLRSPGLVVDCREPRQDPFTVSLEAGSLLDATHQQVGPSGTRWVLGGPGEGVYQRFLDRVDTALEGRWGPLGVAEVYVQGSIGSDLVTAERDLQSARDQLQELAQEINELTVTLAKEQVGLRAFPDDAARQQAVKDGEQKLADKAPEVAEKRTAVVDAEAELERARENYTAVEVPGAFIKAAADGAPSSGLSLSLSETTGFAYGDERQVGDRISGRVGAQLVTDVLRETTFTYGDQGLSITPVAGRIADAWSSLGDVVLGLVRDRRGR